MTELRNWCALAGLAILAGCGGGSQPAEGRRTTGASGSTPPGSGRTTSAPGCSSSGRVTERSPETVLADDIVPFDDWAWQDDFEWEVDMEAQERHRLGGRRGAAIGTAKYHGDQGCTILEAILRTAPTRFASRPCRSPGTSHRRTSRTGRSGTPAPRNPTRPAWTARRSTPRSTPRWEPNRTPGRSRWSAAGRIVGERYAPGFTRKTPQISWSEGKSLTATLIGVLMQEGHFGLDDPAPVAEWREEGDPRGVILMRHLLTMTSGLDMTNTGFDGPPSLVPENEHMRVYFDALDVFEHASSQPYGIPPGTEFRYRNSDPLTLGRIVRETVEGAGGEYLTFPQRMLFDRIGSRDFVLEPDPWGNFILSGYEYGSAADWMRFGLLHLWNGVFEGDRILPEYWSEFVSSLSPGAKEGEYGGLWWLNLGGRYADIPSDAYWALGHMGQVTMVIPSRDVVVVRLGPSPGGHDAYLNTTVGAILAAFDDSAD